MLLDVLLKVGVGLRHLTPVLDGDGGAASSLSGVSFLVVFALTEPFSEFGSAVDLDEWDLVLLGKGGDGLLVNGIITVLGENADESILSIKSLTNLVESLDET